MKPIKRALKRMLFKLRYKNTIKLGRNANIASDAVFEGENSVGENSIFAGCMGYGTYIGDNSQIYGKVGRYTCIASNVHVVNGFHPTQKIVSMHPAFYTESHPTTESYVDKTIYQEYRWADSDREFDVVIGNDVWVGFGAILMAGIIVGDGAVIAAGAVVTKNVPPYSIVAGVPAKKIGQRFTDIQIEKLMKDPWWGKPVEWIRKHAVCFSDINAFEEEYL